MHISIIRPFFWTIPFLCALLGYYGMSYIMPTPMRTVPHVLGNTLSDIILVAQTIGIPLCIEQLVEDPDLPHGTIIRQSPDGGMQAKRYTPLNIVVTTQPESPVTPELIGLSEYEIEHTIKNSAHMYIHKIPSSTLPAGICCAQYPHPGEPISNKTITVYITAEPAKLIVWPSFIGKSLSEVTEFLAQYTITPTVNSENYHPDAPIIEQRPLAGSIISLQTIPTVQLKI